MKNMVLIAAAASVLGATALDVAAQSTYGDVAKVISATPVYDRVSSPRRDCRPEQVTAYEERRAVREEPPRESGGIGPGTVIGPIVGGVIGHQMGSSSAGRDHGTAAGAVIGGVVGNGAGRRAAGAPPDWGVHRAP